MIHVCLASDPPADVGNALAKLAEYQQDVDAHTNYDTRVDEAKKAWDAKTGSVAVQCLREVLKSMCSGDTRCMFCEDSCGDEIEHFRPKSLYPESVFDWANFLFACGKCNRSGYKGSKFSVFAPDGTIMEVTRKKGAPKIKPPAGEPLLIHPRFEDPLMFLYLDLDSGVLEELNKDKKTIGYERAKYTIELLDLNEREELSGARRRVFREHKDTLEMIARLRAEPAPDHEIEERRQIILKRGHGVVWEQMKRLATKRRDLQKLFDAVPEALAW